LKPLNSILKRRNKWGNTTIRLLKP
jgi:hypothetical protein